MKTRSFFLGLWAFTFGIGVNAEVPSWKDPSLWTRLARHSVAYFDERAWDVATGSYLSDISFEGGRTSEARYLIALSRMIYGLSVTAELTGEKQYLDRAKKAFEFLRQKMVRQGAEGPYFLPVVDGSGKSLMESAPLLVHEQAYGLCGPVALYQQTQDRDLLYWIRGMYRAFYRRFHDDQYEGFFDGGAATKSFNSTVYVPTSFLFALYEADEEKRGNYRWVILELADLLERHFLDPKTGWIIENFDRQWRPDWRGWQKQGDSTVGVAGHNFQAAWALLRAAEIAEPEARQRYQTAARRILQAMLKSRAVDRAHGGFGDVFQRETGQPLWHTNKAWWQQAEGILALTLAERQGVLTDPQALEVRDNAVRFYVEHFVDWKNGGEFAVVDALGKPLATEPKGHRGKSTYHTTELSRFLLRYARPARP